MAVLPLSWNFPGPTDNHLQMPTTPADDRQDAELVRRAVAGERDAFAAIYERYRTGVRMPRSAFARLVPIANPDGDGLVDVEMLVGEDGVARSIRRAAAVGWADAN